jgi:CheY-like chemotaxis protein
VSFPILLVEDDSGDRELMTYVFEEARLDVTLSIAKDGEQAVEAIKASRPGLVLLDLKLPRLSGFEVLSWMRAGPLTKDIPVIIMTSSQETRDIERAYALGANSYIVKNAALGALIDVVKGIGEYANLLGRRGIKSAAAANSGGFF